MQRKISRKERLLALSMVFVMIFTSLSSSFAMALTAQVTSATQATVESGGINWGFKLKDTNSKTYTATCMEPHNQSIPAKGNKVNLTAYSRSSTMAWIAYLGKDRHKDDKELQQYVIARAAARRAGNVDKNNYDYYKEVNDLYDDAKAKADAGEKVSENFRAYKAEPTNGSQTMIAWRTLDKTVIKLQKSVEEETKASLAGAKYGVYSTKANAKADKNRLATLTTKKDGSTNTYSAYFVGQKRFYVKEVSAPKGFELDPIYHNKLLSEGDEFTFESEEPLETETEDAKVQVIKDTDIDTIPDGYSLAGAKYGIYKTEAAAKKATAANNGNSTSSNYVGTMTTKTSGKTNVLALEPGTYYVTEYDCPDWMVLDADCVAKKVTLTAGKTEKLTSTNPAKPGRIGVKKSVEGTLPPGKTLEGIQYGIFVSTEAAEENSSDPELRVAVLTIQADGFSGYLSLPAGDYFIREIYCPSWLEMDTTIEPFSLKPEEPLTKEYTDLLKKGKLQIIKSVPGVNPEELPEGYSLAGAKYGVYDTYKHAQANTSTGRLHTLTTDKYGVSNVIILDPGIDYYIREYECPGWLELDKEIKPVNLQYGETEVKKVVSTDNKKPGYITLLKKSSVEPPPYSLEGAEYGIYTSEAEANANTGKVGTLITKSDGTTNTVEVEPNKFYYIKEYKPPKNYESDPTVHRKFVSYGDYVTETVLSTDVPYGSAKVLKSAAKDPFVLTECPQQYSLAGAEYTIYSSESLSESSKVAVLTTKANGESNVVDLPQGTYWILETKASPGFYKDGQPPTKIVVTPGKTTEHTSKEVPMFDPITIILDKKSGNDKANKPSLAGAEFKVQYYTKVATNTSELSGMEPARTWYFETKEETIGGKLVGAIRYMDEYRVAGKSHELYKDSKGEPVGLIGSYVITETRAPKGYVIDPTPMLSTVKSNGTVSNPQISYTNKTNVNDPKEFRVKLVKQDSETGKTPQGDATLEGAVFGLYRNGELVDKYTTGADFTFTTPYHNIGDGTQKYTLKEITPPEGYLPHTTVYDLSELEGNTITVQYTTVERTVNNNVIKGKIAITKILDAKSIVGGLTPEPGVNFEIYLTSAGSYAAAKDSEKQTITTDKHGFAETKMLPYGTYTVHQVNTTTGYEKVPDFNVVINEHNETYRYTLNDKEYTADVKVTKVDSETGKIIPLSGATFKVKNVGTGDWVSFEIKYPTKHTVTEFVTDASGSFQLPDVLPYGTYELVEIAAPTGYIVSSAPVPFVVDGSKTLIELTVENTPQKGVVEVNKTGEIFKSVSVNADGTYTPVFGEGNIRNAVFEIFAKEDIVTPDGTKRYSAGEKVDTITTGTDGKAVSKELYLGKYEVKEVTAGENHVLNTSVFDAELTYDAEKVQVSDPVAVKNERQKVSVTLAKNLETDDFYGYGSENYKDIVFGIYADEIISAENGTSIPKGGLIQTIHVTKDGAAYSGSFTCDLPHGNYYVQEAETAEGYVLDDTKYAVDFTYKDQNTATVAIAANNGTAIENEIIRGDIAGHKISESNVNLSGAVIGLFKHGETVFTESTALLTDTSDKNGEFDFTDVAYGKYIVREIKAPIGYALNTTEYAVTVSTDGQIIELDVVNEVTKYDIAKTDIATGNYVIGTQLAIIPLDEDGNPDPAQTYVTWITEEKEFRVEGLEVGKTYILRETLRGEAWDYGYVTAEDIEFTVPDTGKVQKIEMKDDFTKLDIAKTDITTGEPVIGAQLSIIPLDENGNPDEGATFETWITGDKEHRVERIPVGEYILREKLTGQAWDYGYVTAEDVKFTVTDTGVVQKVEMKDDYTKVEITKTDIATGEPVIGAQLSIIPLDEEGNPDVGATFDTWLTEKDPHYIERIPVGEYILRETLTGEAWDAGYVTAEDVKFTVADTGEIQKVDMKDDFTKLEITKTDITTGEPVIGAQLSIIPLDEEGNPDVGATFDTWLTEKDPHYIERIPVGEYILREKLTGQAWDAGYVTAEDVKFTVKDTGVVQKVEMNDDYTKVEIMKTDIETGDPVIGTQLALIPLDENGKPDVGATFDTWITDDKAHYMEYVPVGEYIVRETLTGQAWDYGYVTAEDLKITVTDSEKIQKFEMKDDFTKVEITKTDITTGEPVIGAQLSIIPLDENGKPDAGATFDTWITDDKPHYIERIPVGKYILRETLTGQAWDYGYVTAEDVVFEVKDTPEIQKVDMDDDYTKVEITKTDITTGNAVIGTQLSLIPLDENGEPKIGETFDTWITDDKAHYMEYVPVGDYIVREKLSGAAWDYGYVTAEDLKISIKDTGEVQKFDMDDDYTKIEITKTDIKTDKPVLGTQLSLIPLDENGKPDVGATFDTWITDDKAHYMEYVPVGDYIVREKLSGAAWDNGYVTAEDLVITVKDTAEVQKFDMDDDYTKIEITKTDITTKEPVIGAQLSIIPLDENGKPDVGATFDTWLTEKDPHYIERIPVGEYILREKLTGQAWDYGYVTAEDVRFSVKDTPVVQKVEMNDDYTKVEFSKTDITTGEPVIGAQLSIIPLDENGKPDVGATFDTWITTEKPHMVEYLPIGDYILREVLAGAADYGYVSAEDVKFTVNDTGIVQKVEMKDDYTKLEITKADSVTNAGIPDTELSLYPVDDEGKVSDKAFVTAKTDKNGKMYVEYIPIGEYVLRETGTNFGAGYVTAQDVRLTVMDTGMVQTVTMKDDHTKVEITKTDITTGEPVVGAELSIYPVDKDGTVSNKPYTTWVTTDAPHLIEYIPAGNYVLREVLANAANAGYVTAEEVSFTVADSGEIQKVEMKDDHTKVEILKTDIETGEQIEGATLQILKPDGTLVEEFESTETAYETTYLPVGDYILRETKAPAGYVKAEMKFTVADTADVQTFEFKNDFIKVEILKKDAENKKVLPGAKLQLLDENGKKIASWTSSDEAMQFNRLPAGTYTLKEVKAPAGYEIAKPVTFTVKETADVQTFILLDDKLIVPETGDANHPMAWMMLAMFAAGSLITVKRRREEMGA